LLPISHILIYGNDHNITEEMSNQTRFSLESGAQKGAAERLKMLQGSQKNCMLNNYCMLNNCMLNWRGQNNRLNAGETPLIG
jgi:hypothetical protein